MANLLHKVTSPAPRVNPEAAPDLRESLELLGARPGLTETLPFARADGFFTANACVFAAAVFLLLMGSAGVPALGSLAMLTVTRFTP